jgi:hypothetical protein
MATRIRSRHRDDILPCDVGWVTVSPARRVARLLGLSGDGFCLA